MKFAIVQPSTSLYYRKVDRPTKLSVVSALSDHCVRVRGDIRKVFKYLSDLRHYGDFDASMVEIQKMGGGDSRVNVGTRFQAVHSPFPGISIPVTYVVAEFIPHKRIVLAGNAESFKTTKTLALMTHPAQKDYTAVRQIVDIQMKDWKSMIPMLDVQLAKREEATIANMEKILNSRSSPLRDLHLDAEDMRSTRRSMSSSSGSYGSLDMEEHNGSWRDFGNMLGNLWNNSRPGGQNAAANWVQNGTPNGTSYSNSHAYNGANSNGQYASSNGTGYTTTATAVVLSDPLGYYEVLGLDTSKSVSEDDIKSAFRAAAQQLHPDKMATADERTRKAAKIQFQILQAAYSTLKDPVKRNMYDRGQLSLGSDV